MCIRDRGRVALVLVAGREAVAPTHSRQAIQQLFRLSAVRGEELRPLDLLQNLTLILIDCKYDDLIVICHSQQADVIIELLLRM